MLRTITLVFILLASVSSFADEISGLFLRENGVNYVRTTESGKDIILVAANEESKQAISQLNSTDLMYGTGELNGDTFLLNSVDVVGLRQLLGSWKSRKTQLDFVNFKYVLVRKIKQAAPKQTLHYVVTPGSEASQWRVFFSDEKSVSLASLSLEGRRAVFEFFDENTGEVVDRIILKKQ